MPRSTLPFPTPSASAAPTPRSSSSATTDNNMTGIMQGKRGLIMGVANNHSIAWGISKALAAQGAELAFTFQGDALGKRVKPLAAELGSDFLLPCDVEDIASVDTVIDTIKERWGKLDFIVHAIGFS